MKIFISHAIADKALIAQLKQGLEPYGLKLLVAEHSVDMRKTITQKIEAMMNSCHVGLILLTLNGFESKFVQQEIGYLKAKKKPILQVVEKGIGTVPGLTYGHDCIQFSPSNRIEVIERVTQILLNHWKELIANKRRKQEEEKKRKDKNLAWAGLCLLSAAIVFGSDD